MRALFLLLLFSFYAFSDLVLEITEGASKPVKIAILEKNNNSMVGQEIIEIVSNDLKRTGEF